MVPKERFANYSANDFDEQRAVQRTSGRVSAIDPVLAGLAHAAGVADRYGMAPECVINLFERILATRGYRFAGGHRCQN